MAANTTTYHFTFDVTIDAPNGEYEVQSAVVAPTEHLARRDVLQTALRHHLRVLRIKLVSVAKKSG